VASPAVLARTSVIKSLDRRTTVSARIEPKSISEELANRQSPAALSEPIAVARWWCNRNGGAVRVTLEHFKGQNVVDVRNWRADVTGVMRPGRGFAIGIKLNHLVQALAAAVAKDAELELPTRDPKHRPAEPEGVFTDGARTPPS
jgi:transcriptional coactivator p15 (PC4)